MAIRSLTFSQFLPISLQEAWEFFSSPQNLNEITPPDMVFKITSEIPETMYAGMFITYKVSPLLGIQMEWITEITHVDPQRYFVDEQRKGPYKIWHHEHHFEAVEGGVVMTDRLYYDVGKSFVGSIASYLMVDRKVGDIFRFREQKLNSLFGKGA